MDKKLSQMTVEELKELKHCWYEIAKEKGELEKCCQVCRVLGENMHQTYGPKYLYKEDKEDELELFVDDYGGFATAHWNGKTVMSTHPCDRIFIPGKWMETVNRLYNEAVIREASERRAKDEKQRGQLIAELSIPTEPA